MLDKLVNFRFVAGCCACTDIILTCFVFCLCVPGNAIAEAPSFKKVDVRFNEDRVYVDDTFRPVLDLGIKSGVDVFSEAIEFFSFVSSKAKAVPENKAEKKGNESDNDTLFHWLFPVFTFLFGLYASGYFHDVARDKKKSNVKLRGDQQRAQNDEEN